MQRRFVERREPRAVARRHLRTRVDQQRHEIGIATARREVQRRHARGVGRVHVGSAADQQFCNIRAIADYGVIERRGTTFEMASIDIGAVRDQRFHEFGRPRPHGVVQRRRAQFVPLGLCGRSKRNQPRDGKAQAHR